MVGLKEGQPCPWGLLLDFFSALGHIELSQKGNQKIYRINRGSVTIRTNCFWSGPHKTSLIP